MVEENDDVSVAELTTSVFSLTKTIWTKPDLPPPMNGLMAGGGEKRRKLGIDIEWEKLLPSGPIDDEPPPIIVIQKAGERREQVEKVVLDDEEEESHSNMDLSHISDMELMDTIARLRNTWRLKLPDGGEKARASLKAHEAELQRRKNWKDDYKSRHATSSVDALAHDATDNSTLGAPHPIPAPQSTFAAHFCRNLDEEKVTKSFSEELSTLNHSHPRSIRLNEQLPIHRTEIIGLSSRQVPFKSPCHLSSTSSHSEKDMPSSSGKKECNPRFQPLRGSRRTNKAVVLVDEEELEVDVNDQPDKESRSSKHCSIYYPSRDDPEAIEICCSDMECLAPESFLSSTIMNFYIRYLQKSASASARKNCDYHFFNTYFYEKLKRDVLNKINKEKSFLKFRRWWKGVNIFEKAYIFVPIHENEHWSLVIICLPMKEDESGPVILHLDSLGFHLSESIFKDVKSFLVEEWKFLRQGNLQLELPIADHIWDKLSRKINEKVIEVPRQPNEYDCGIFVLYFMERFIEEAPERLKSGELKGFGSQWFRAEEVSSLRPKIRDLLREEFNRQMKEHVH